MRRLEEQLRNQARAIPVRSTEALHHRIMAGLTFGTIVPAKHRARPVYAATLAALLTAVTVGIWLIRPPSDERRTASVPDLVSLTAPIPSAVLGQVGSPLDRETAALKNDILTASQYLLELTGI